jgi:hypothetical protein
MLKDIFEVVRAVADYADVDSAKENIKDALLTKRRDSIVSRAKDSIAMFPAIFSTSVSQTTAMMLIKALEVEYAELFRIVLSNEGIIDLDSNDANTKRSLVRKFHQNTYVGARDGIDVSSVVREQVQPEHVFQACRELLTASAEDLNLESLNDMTIKNVRIFTEARENEIKNNGVRSQIDTKEIKKFGTMEPLILRIEVQYKTNAGSTTTTELVLGVKVVPHFVDTNEMTYYVGSSIKHESVVFRIIQWATGEIQFFRDLLLTVDQAKDDARSSSSMGRTSASLWWHKLRSLAKSSKFRNLLGTEKILPNATMVLTMDEAQHLKATEGLDLMDPKNAQKLVEVFFLMRLTVVDEADEIAYMYDEDTMSYNRYSYSSLSKSGNTNELKALVSLLSR